MFISAMTAVPAQAPAKNANGNHQIEIIVPLLSICHAGLS
jgi:hypothetical protein